MTPANPFAELLERIRQGDREALGHVLGEYEPALRRFARAHLGPALRPYADSVDLVQSAHKSVMIALWSNKYEFSGPEKLLALAKTILQRKVARLAERTGRHQRSLAGPPSRETAPDEVAEFHNTLEHVCRQLNEQERAIFERLIQGYTRKEIAAELGKDPHAFRVYWGRVMERLRASGALNSWLAGERGVSTP